MNSTYLFDTWGKRNHEGDCRELHLFKGYINFCKCLILLFKANEYKVTHKRIILFSILSTKLLDFDNKNYLILTINIT